MGIHPKPVGRGMHMKTKTVISFAAGVLLSGLGFYFAFSRVPFSGLAESMSAVNYLWLAPGAALGLFSFVVRAVRWQMILGASRNVPFFSAYHPLMIGFMINTVLPGRIGELARPAFLAKQDNVPFSLGMTTVAAERVLDMLTLIVMFAWVTAAVPIDPDLQIQFHGYRLDRAALKEIAMGISRVCIVLAAVLVAFSFQAVQRFLKFLILRAPETIFPSGSLLAGKVHERCCLPLARVIDHVGIGLSLIQRPLRFALCIGASLVIWVLQAFALQIAALGFPVIDLEFYQMTAVFIIVCFFIVLPSVPGYWGIWEAGGVFGLSLFGVQAGPAAGFSLASHAMLLFPVMAAGIVSAVMTGIRISGIGSLQWRDGNSGR